MREVILRVDDDLRTLAVGEADIFNGDTWRQPNFYLLSLFACRLALFLALIIKDSGVGRMSNTPVLIVDERRSHDIAFVSGSAIIVEVSIQRG